MWLRTAMTQSRFEKSTRVSFAWRWLAFPIFPLPVSCCAVDLLLLFPFTWPLFTHTSTCSLQASHSAQCTNATSFAFLHLCALSQKGKRTDSRWQLLLLLCCVVLRRRMGGEEAINVSKLSNGELAELLCKHGSTAYTEQKLKNPHLRKLAAKKLARLLDEGLCAAMIRSTAHIHTHSLTPSHTSTLTHTHTLTHFLCLPCLAPTSKQTHGC